ncbi:homeobox protein DLX-1-like isoform X2 [Paramacrobiotus metropolitanus]|uniref:homeobox protein DLX-1-like isoform X2 n=1 Tax=Paramacrobiotus metropolitanus TaxID=2943436 RepID=UPI002445B832|nr:homeobox protein DLX-1-like isoform X2 [Paramacrobiotus metropolitanus]
MSFKPSGHRTKQSHISFHIKRILQSSKRKRLDYSHAHRPPSPVTFKFALPSLTGLSPSCARPTSESIVHLYGYERPTYAVPPGCYSSDVFGYNQLNYPAENMGSLRFRDNIPPSCWDANNIMNTVPSIVQRLPLAVSFRSQPTYAPTAGQLTTPSRSTANSNAVGSRHGHTASKRKKTWTRAVFSSLQRKGLERSFVAQQYISKKDRRKLAATLGLTDSQSQLINSGVQASDQAVLERIP